MSKLTRSEQARINGAKSRGPTTAGGKLHSSMNAFKTGKYAKNAVLLSSEDPIAFDAYHNAYVRRIQPACPVEASLVHELASVDWRLARNLAMETCLIEKEMAVQSPALACAGANPSLLERTTTAAANVHDRSRFQEFLARRENSLLRARDLTQRALQRIRMRYPLPAPSTVIRLTAPLDPDSVPELEPGTNPLGPPPASTPAESPKPFPNPEPRGPSCV